MSHYFELVWWIPSYNFDSALFVKDIDNIFRSPLNQRIHSQGLSEITIRIPVHGDSFHSYLIEIDTWLTENIDKWELIQQKYDILGLKDSFFRSSYKLDSIQFVDYLKKNMMSKIMPPLAQVGQEQRWRNGIIWPA